MISSTELAGHAFTQCAFSSKRGSGWLHGKHNSFPALLARLPLLQRTLLAPTALLTLIILAFLCDATQTNPSFLSPAAWAIALSTLAAFFACLFMPLPFSAPALLGEGKRERERGLGMRAASCCGSPAGCCQPGWHTKWVPASSSLA